MYVEHNDGYSFYYPGRDEDMNQRAIIMTQHAYRMNALSPPEVVPAVACPQYNFSSLVFPPGLGPGNLGLE